MDQQEIFRLWREAVPGVPYSIESVPPGRRVLLWWTPKGNPNPYAECWIVGTVCDHSSRYWHGDTSNGEGYGEMERITHWTPLPPRARD